MKYFGKSFNDVSIVKDIPSGLPVFGIPEFDLDLIKRIITNCFNFGNGWLFRNYFYW